MNLDDTEPEQIFDQRENGTVVALQQPADRGKRPVDVVLGAAQRDPGRLGTFSKPKSTDGQPLLTANQSGVVRQLVVDGDHGDRLDREPGAGSEREQIVDRHDVLDIGIGRRPRHDERAGAWPRRHQVVVAQPPQCLTNRVAAYREPLAQLMLGRQLRPHRVNPVDDLLAQRPCHLQIAVVDRLGFGHVGALQDSRADGRRASMLPSASADT